MVAWEVQWFDKDLPNYQEKLHLWAKTLGFKCKDTEWLSHVTISRSPFNPKQWEEEFTPLPCFAKAIHLYESLGASNYQSLWTHPLHPPFIEIPHTADIAFSIFGQDLIHLYCSAFIALAFKYPRLTTYFQKPPSLTCLDEVIIELNRLISSVDQKEGCPLKAVSFHGEIQSLKENQIQWEMIVDI